jgi:hypothetical protein
MGAPEGGGDRPNILHKLDRVSSPYLKFTKEGGLAVYLINKTGVDSEKGRIVRGSAVTDDGVILTVINDPEIIGVMYEDGIADGERTWIVVSGRCQVLLDDNTGSTAGNWVQAGTAGYCDATNVAPVGVPAHWREVGHSLQTVAAGGAGTHMLCFIMMHFN